MFEITFELAKIKGVIDRYAIGGLILKVEKIIIICSSLTGQFLDANFIPTTYLIAVLYWFTEQRLFLLIQPQAKEPWHRKTPLSADLISKTAKVFWICE